MPDSRFRQRRGRGLSWTLTQSDAQAVCCAVKPFGGCTEVLDLARVANSNTDSFWFHPGLGFEFLGTTWNMPNIFLVGDARSPWSEYPPDYSPACVAQRINRKILDTR